MKVNRNKSLKIFQIEKVKKANDKFNSQSNLNNKSLYQLYYDKRKYPDFKITFTERNEYRGTDDDETIIEYIEKAKFATCKIEINESQYGSGFFCKIPYQEDENILINVLLTCEHVLEYDSVFSDKDLKIIVNNEEKIISLKKKRKRWSNKIMDYSCIEILKEDNIKDYYILDIKY